LFFLFQKQIKKFFFIRKAAVHPHIPYEVESVFVDLIDFAAQKLKVGGRLVYWLPTTNE